MGQHMKEGNAQVELGYGLVQYMMATDESMCGCG